MEPIANNLKTTKTLSLIFEVFAKGIIKTRLLISLSLFLGLVLFPPISHFAFAPKVSAASISQKPIVLRSAGETYYLDAINKLRQQRNLKPLIIDSRLSRSAYEKAEDMSNKDYFGHFAPDGKSFSDFIWSDSPAALSVAEDLAQCFDSREKAFDALIASPTHLSIMVGQYDNLGVAETYNKNNGCIETVLHFSRYNK